MNHRASTRAGRRLTRRIRAVVAGVAVLAASGAVVLGSTGAYFSASAGNGAAAAAGSLPAVALTASKAGATAGQATSLQWGSAATALAAQGSTSGVTYTVQRSTTSAFSNPTTVYTGTATSFTDSNSGVAAVSAGSSVDAVAVSPVGTFALKPSMVSVGGTTVCEVETNLYSHYCWGNTSSGQTGTGIKSGTLTTPTAQSYGSDLGSDHYYSQIALGSDFGCGVTAWGGSVHCWGNEALGRLGDGAAGSYITAIPRYASGTGYFASPYNMSWTGHAAIAVAAGSAHACSVEVGNPWDPSVPSNFLVCWGYDWYGQTGPEGQQTFPSYSANPSIVQAGALPRYVAVTQVAAGGHSTCALTATNVIACFGANNSGALGSGMALTAKTSTPTAVSKVNLGSRTITKLVGGGADSTAYCALTSDKQVYCWGEGHTVPTRVFTTLPNITGVSTGNGVCVISDGSVYCLPYTSALSPTPLDLAKAKIGGALAGLTAVSVDQGWSSGCAVTSVPSLVCWGSNGDGQLGNGTTTPSATSPLSGEFASCPTGAAVVSGGNCSLTPAQTYYYRVTYKLDGVETWVSSATTVARS